jgi:adenylate cyclase
MLFSRFIRSFGILIIILFSIGTMFLGIFTREMSDDMPNLKGALINTSSFEDRFYDYRMRKNLDHGKKIKNIILAKLDDEALKVIGRWPWKRQIWADLIHKFESFGTKSLAFDVIFSEPELVCGNANGDIALSESIRSFQAVPDHKVILTYSNSRYQSKETYPETPEDLYNFMLDSKSDDENASLERYFVSNTTYPIKELLAAEPALGYISNEPSLDGSFRYYPLVNNIDSLYMPSMGLIAYMNYKNTPISIELGVNQSSIFNLGDKKIQLNGRGETKIRWIGDEQNFASVSLARIIKADDNDPDMINLLKDNLVFIGSTAIGAHDLRNTPINPTLPGVYSHMNMAYMLDQAYFYKPSEESISYSLYILAIGVILLLLIQLLSNPILDIVGLVSLIVAAYWIDHKFFINSGYEIKLFFCFFSFTAIYSWNTFLNFIKSNKEKKQIRGTFARYVAPSIVDEMLGNPEKLKVGGEKKNITCMFTDVRDFTTISEKLTPQELSHCLNIYMGRMTDIVFDTQGTLDKYIGDAIVAYWGAPLEVEGHPQKAVLAALEMIEVLPDVNKEFKVLGYPEFKIGIGLNSGDCSVGNMGSNTIFSYTALGDNMNLGARLEGLCKFYGCQIVISEYTLAEIDTELIIIRKLDKVRVKGKEKPVKIYEVLHSFHDFRTDNESYVKYDKAYDLYQDKQFKECSAIFTELSEKYPADKASARFRDFANEYIANPPDASWDGVYTFTEK